MNATEKKCIAQTAGWMCCWRWYPCTLDWSFERRLWIYWIAWGYQVVSIGWIALFFLTPK